MKVPKSLASREVKFALRHGLRMEFASGLSGSTKRTCPGVWLYRRLWSARSSSSASAIVSVAPEWIAASKAWV